MERKEKLIKLFKQCCDSENFSMNRKTESVNNNHARYSVSECDFEINPDIKKEVEDIGYTKLKLNTGDIKTNRLGRVFEFDEEPPLYLTKASVSIECFLDSRFITLSDVESHPGHHKTKIITQEKNFWGREKIKEKEALLDIETRRVDYDKGMIERLFKFIESRRVDGDYPEVMRFIPRFHDKEYTYFLGDGFNKSRHYVVGNYSKDEKWAKKTLVNYYELWQGQGINDDEKIMNIASIHNFDINGGTLRFGELWCWLSYDEYKELNDYYLDSIKKTHEAVLNVRLSETK